jgi:Sulfocyanin (SoxE) domain
MPDDLRIHQTVHRDPPAAGTVRRPGRARRRWAWALALALAAVAPAVPFTLARRDEPTPRGTPVNVLLEDFKVRRDAAVVPAGTVSFRILNQGPTTHEFIVVRTDRDPDKLPLQGDGLTVNEDAPGIDLLDEAEGLDIDDRQTLVLDLMAGHYVMYCNLQGHYLGGMHAALTVR